MHNVATMSGLRQLMYRANLWGEVPITCVSDFVPGMLQQWEMLPYSMHYWYFNVINPHTDFVLSYILARATNPVKLNAESVSTGDAHQYTAVLADFQRHQTITHAEPVTYSDHQIVTSKLQLDLANNSVDLAIAGHHYSFNDLYQPSCYLCDRLGIYTWYNMLAQNQHSYFMAQNVIARGPLVPWQWLHFYLNSGERITFFSLAGQGRQLLAGSRVMNIERIEQTARQFEVIATQGDYRLRLVLNKHYDAKVTYDPSWSPAWEYNQIHVNLHELDTNLPEYVEAEKGSGILEIAAGFAL